MEQVTAIKPSTGVTWQSVLCVGLALSIGWGIRGNFGHEYGAAIPGALAAMAVVLLSGREDWQRRIAYFGMFGAVGWSFGGSISYMQVIAYTHSGDSLTVWYGFACLFVIGFLWAAVGGAGTALPAFLSRERLTEFFAPLIAVFASWQLWDFGHERLINSDFRQNDPFYWYDSDWMAALLAIIVVLVFALIRRRLDKAGSLILHMALGWWAGFLILVVALHLRMTPPRGDNWAGSLGMTVGMLVYLQRNKLQGVTFAALVSGIIGGLGFAAAPLFKLIEIKSGLDTNWHSILEQTYGLINGIGIAVAMGPLILRAPRVSDDPPVRRWTEGFAVCFLLIFVTYFNLEKLVEDWVKAKTVPKMLYFLPAHGWFDLAYAALALAFVWLLWEHMRRPLPLVPTSWLGKGQMLCLLFLWWIVIGNFVKAIVAFAPQRLVTEGTIHVNALLCTLMLLLWSRHRREPSETPSPPWNPALSRALLSGAAAVVLFPVLAWGIVRALYGDIHAPYASLHIRFGPHATATTEKPKANQPHP
ncbi:MAG TPA: hypothetical protein VKU00_18565 [Chthonomonadaceae bacterium]|nr:hypothetical protein [Chthonomonadaceae bacterium]